jgi:hypothetical protein
MRSQAEPQSLGPSNLPCNINSTQGHHNAIGGKVVVAAVTSAVSDV